MEERYAKFTDMIKEVRINVPLIDVLADMPNYEKFRKDIVIKKSKMEQISAAFLHEECSAIVQNKLPLKLGDSVSFLIPLVISALLKDDEKKRLVLVLKNHKEAFAWKTSDILCISPSFCKHKINFEDEAKPIIQRKLRLNPNMKEVVKKDIIKLLDAGIIYPIEDSHWVSPIHYVPKKGGMTVVTNENNELVPIRTVTGWRASREKILFFLDGFSRYFQIPIEPGDQEKTIFTCPYGTYAYKRMPFGLCNAPATFQRCMITIFQDMLEISMEVFMDDFFVFGNSFASCLANLKQILIRCKQAHLVLNGKKCHFMMIEGIVLGHKVSSAGLEVDKAKINVIAKLPPPTSVKAVRSFLGHAGFYRRFI
ncbi:reverse transcriptase domain-containing protein [Tanacetum coccineum]